MRIAGNRNAVQAGASIAPIALLPKFELILLHIVYFNVNLHFSSMVGRLLCITMVDAERGVGKLCNYGCQKENNSKLNVIIL